MPDDARPLPGLPMPILPKRPVSRHGRVTAVSMMKDEGPYLLEWVAHHLAIGFTDLVVYTNDCSDGTDDLLIRLQALGLAHHRRNVIPAGIKPQPSALNHAALEPVVGESDWVMVFDADEFLSIRHGDGTLDGMLDAVVDRGASGIVLTWRIFGSGGIVEWSRDFVTEQYRMAAPPLWNKGWGVKTLFRYDPGAWKLGIHRPKMKNKVLETDYPTRVQWLNGSGRPMEDYFKFRGWRSILRTVGYDWAQMNHYAVKSVDSFAIRKFRGNVNNKTDKYNDAYWSLQDRNEVRDDTMLRLSAQRRAIFDGLLGDPELNRLHHAALTRAEARLASLKAMPAYGDFVARLAIASAVPIDAVEAKPPKARDKDAIAARMTDIEQHVAHEKAVAAAAPVENYATGPIGVDNPGPVTWHENHSLRLPADARVFTPQGLTAIAEGKFERNLARNLPGLLPPGGHYVEVGAISGFVGTQIAAERPDARVTLFTTQPGAAAFIANLWCENGIAASDRLTCTPWDGALPAADIVALADPSLTPDALAALLAAAPRQPAGVLLTGPLWVAARAEYWGPVLAPYGLTTRAPLGPGLCAMWARTA